MGIKYLVPFIVGLLSSIIDARPVSYPGGITVMGFSDNMKDSIYVHYSPTHYYSLGLETKKDKYSDSDYSYLRFTYLLDRKNTQHSQRNFYFQSGVSPDKASNHFIGFHGDWETRRLYAGFSYKNAKVSSQSYSDQFIQLGIALWLYPPLVGILLIAWAYLGLMSREFFVREWIKSRPITYLWTHMGIMPLVDLYATATEWMPRGATVPDGLIWFLVVSFFNGVVIEVGRKIRSTDEEKPGVSTYTKLWGQRGAPLIWFGFLLVTAISASIAGSLIEFGLQTFIVLAILLLVALLVVIKFSLNPSSRSAKYFELMSGIWTLMMYLTLGLGPFLQSTL